MMEEEWKVYLRENKPHLYEDMMGSTSWRYHKIEQLKEDNNRLAAEIDDLNNDKTRQQINLFNETVKTLNNDVC